MNKNVTLAADIEGQRFELTADKWNNLDCIQISENTYHLIEDGKTYTIIVLESDNTGKKISFRIEGENKSVTLLSELELLIERMGLNIARSKKLLVLHAPMPGLVTNIKVKAGDQVEEGAPLLILEAMKMENVISAPHQAQIKKINVTIGQAIDKGTALVEFADV